MRNRAKFSEFMTIISEMFEKRPSTALTEIYWTSLKPFTDEQCKKAFNEVILSSRFFPKPVDIIETIRGTQGNRATEAWTEVLGALRKKGAYSSVKFNDPAIHTTIEAMGGWIELGNMLVGDEKWKQKEFEKLYPIMERRGGHSEYLAGRIEINNSAKGFTKHIPETELIGEVEKKPEKVKLIA